MNYNEILARRIVAEVAHIGRQQGMQPVMLHGHAGPTSDDGVIKRNSLRKTGGGSLTSSDDFDHHCVCSACLASYPLPEDRSVPIQTNFHFNQIRDQANAQRMALSTQDLLATTAKFYWRKSYPDVVRSRIQYDLATSQQAGAQYSGLLPRT